MFSLLLKDLISDFIFDPKKATGVDAIPPKIVKAAAPVISRHISNLANEMQAKEAYLTQLKSAQVTPIFKKDDPFIEKITAPSASCQRSQTYMDASSANNWLIILTQSSMTSHLPSEPFMAVRLLFCVLLKTGNRPLTITCM